MIKALKFLLGFIALIAYELFLRESGVYTIVVEARRAKGTIHVQLEGERT